MTEADIERYLLERVLDLGGEVRKVTWVGRRGAPDRVVMLPPRRTLWVELKHPDTGHLFPKDAHERQQAREHERMRAMGQIVVVWWRKDQVDSL